MSHTLTWFNAVLCAAIALRLLLFRRGDASHRPAANGLAYLLIVAAGAVPLLTLFGQAPATGWPQLVLNAVLAAAVFAVRGNVVELFRPVAQPESWLTRLLRKETWI
jgi:hypothetical protein